MNKFLIYCKSDGVRQALHFALKSITSLIFSKSRTNFYESSAIPEFLPNDDISIKEYSETELNLMKFDRLRLINISKWSARGSRCCIGIINGEPPQTYSWLHIGSYNVHNAGVFNLDEKEYWIGPTFVHHKQRGKGYNKQQICWQMQQNGSDAKYYTSVNEKNIASWKSFEYLGFKRIGETFIVKLFGYTVKKEVLGKRLQEKLR